MIDAYEGYELLITGMKDGKNEDCHALWSSHTWGMLEMNYEIRLFPSNSYEN